jgi:hypothetical protein
LANARYRLTATAYVPGAAAVGVEERICVLLADRVPDSDPEVRVTLADEVTISFTVIAGCATEARAEGRDLAAEALLGAPPTTLEAVELLPLPPVPV